MTTKVQFLELWTQLTNEPAPTVNNLARRLSLAGLFPVRQEALTREHVANWLIAVLTGCQHKDVAEVVPRVGGYRQQVGMVSTQTEHGSGVLPQFEAVAKLPLAGALSEALRVDSGIVLHTVIMGHCEARLTLKDPKAPGTTQILQFDNPAEEVAPAMLLTQRQCTPNLLGMIAERLRQDASTPPAPVSA